MTVNEFKAWLEGIRDGKSLPPNKEEWDKIKRKIAQLEDGPIKPLIYPFTPYPRSNWTPNTEPVTSVSDVTIGVEYN